jgi:xylulokinase
MFVGIDLGTSGVKVVLVDADQRVVAQATAPLTVQRPRPLWSEQDPAAWWMALDAAMGWLRGRAPQELGAVRGLGLTGQMHGATLLDAEDRVLRPAILWNDGRSAEQCQQLEQAAPSSRRITGTIAMPGFTAPKLMWVARHEPEVFRNVARVLLPKDYLRLLLTGDYATDLSDAAGTLWLDVANRQWSERMLAVTELDESQMPALYEGTRPTGTLRRQVAEAWGLPADVVVAAGAGDNCGGAVGAGVIQDGQGQITLGTSGVYFVATAEYAPHADAGIHTFCHCIPDRWQQTAVILSAASCLRWATETTGAASEAALLIEAERALEHDSSVIFLPYLSGERTPHNDPNAKGVFFGLTHATTRGDLVRAVLEGVAFAFADGQQALAAAGTNLSEVSVVGGGARSEVWGRILASALDLPLVYRENAELGPAFGAARLARLAATGENPTEVCTSPPEREAVRPDPELQDRYAVLHLQYRKLYHQLKSTFAG